MRKSQAAYSVGEVEYRRESELLPAPFQRLTAGYREDFESVTEIAALTLGGLQHSPGISKESHQECE